MIQSTVEIVWLRNSVKVQGYSAQVERFMCKLNLSEKDQRYYAAVEAMKLGHGGINYIADLFGCCRQTIATGIEELKKTTSPA